jgi:hypothetical protein
MCLKGPRRGRRASSTTAEPAGSDLVRLVRDFFGPIKGEPSKAGWSAEWQKAPKTGGNSQNTPTLKKHYLPSPKPTPLKGLSASQGLIFSDPLKEGQAAQCSSRSHPRATFSQL